MRIEVPKNITIAPLETKDKKLMDKLLERAGVSPEFNGNQRWESLEEIYQTLGQSLLTLANEANKAIGLINTIGVDKIQEKELIVATNTFKNDIQDYTSTLVQIHNRHKGKTGLITDGDSLMEYHGIFIDYNNIREKYHAVLFPCIMTMTENVMASMENYKKECQRQDTAVVTDVEFKEQVKEA